MSDPLRIRVARSIWLAMVNDEAPDLETLEREGFLDAATAAVVVLTEQLVRDLHRKRMGAYGLDTPGSEYEDEVVARVTQALRDPSDAPFLHSHAFEEMGTCVECDAAAILDRVPTEYPAGEGPS